VMVVREADMHVHAGPAKSTCEQITANAETAEKKCLRLRRVDTRIDDRIV
jgi:hypothetical protein